MCTGSMGTVPERDDSILILFLVEQNEKECYVTICQRTNREVQLRGYLSVLTELHELEFRDLPAVGEDDGASFSGGGEAGDA